MNQYYFVDKSNSRQGPVAGEQLKNYGVSEETLVWTQGMANWTPAKSVAELQPLFAPQASEHTMYISEQAYAQQQSYGHQQVQQDEIDAEDYLASGGLRFAGYLIDTACYYALTYLTAYISGMVLALAGYYDFVATSADMLGYLITFIVVMIFYAFFEGLFQATPGKLILGMRVVDANGEKPTFGKIILRSICRFIPFDGLSYFWTTGCWHCTISDTFVVSNHDLKEAKRERNMQM